MPTPPVHLRNTAIGPGEPVRLMAIVNASPESFYSASVAASAQAVADAVRRAGDEGADIVDIGAMSTAPYKDAEVSADIERERMLRAIEAARGVTELPITADTQRAEVAAAALDNGADAINDVSGFAADPGMARLVAQRGVPVVLMASERPGETAQSAKPAGVVVLKLRAALRRAEEVGIPRERIVLDPGIGFFRSQTAPWYEFDMEVLRSLGEFLELGCPLLVSASRKSFLGKLLGRPDAADRLGGSLAAALHCARSGANVLRTHDVRETRDALRMADLLA